MRKNARTLFSVPRAPVYVLPCPKRVGKDHRRLQVDTGMGEHSRAGGYVEYGHEWARARSLLLEVVKKNPPGTSGHGLSPPVPKAYFLQGAGIEYHQ